MIKCPDCGKYMHIKEGNGPFGYYKFYGCNGYVDGCRRKIEPEDAYKYDDGKTLEQVVKEQSQNEGILEGDSYDRAFSAAKISGLDEFESAAFAKNFEKD